MDNRHVIARLFILQGYILYYDGIVIPYQNHIAIVGTRLN